MSKVLIVDDRPSILDVLKMFLELQGYAVITCGEGSTVVDLVRQEHPDVIMLDLILPGKSGIKILEELKTDPELAKIPVIAMTARNEKAVEAAPQAFACIMKPFDITDVLTLIKRALEDRNQAATAN